MLWRRFFYLSVGRKALFSTGSIQYIEAIYELEEGGAGCRVLSIHIYVLIHRFIFFVFFFIYIYTS